MSFNSTLCDMIVRLKNGQNARKLEINIRKSQLSLKIIEILKKEGYIRDYINKENKILVLLKYINDKPVITNINPILNTYTNKYISVNMLKKLTYKLRKTNKGLGLFVLTTPKGILTNYECLCENTGGKILLKII